MQIPNEILLKIIGWLMGIGVGLLVGLGSIAVYIFSEYRKDNDSEHSKLESNICIFRKENRDDIKIIRENIEDEIIRIHERIDSHLEAE